jgi:hypothetical protein
MHNVAVLPVREGMLAAKDCFVCVCLVLSPCLPRPLHYRNHYYLRMDGPPASVIFAILGYPIVSSQPLPRSRDSCSP